MARLLHFRIRGEIMTKSWRSVAVPSLAALGLAAVLTIGVSTAAYAQAGTLDQGFGTGGIATTSFDGPVPAAAALQSNGQIVVAAGLDNTPAATESFGLFRYNANGTLDTTFGTSGIASASFTDFLNNPSDLAIQPNGDIIEVGDAESADGTVNEFAIARFTPDGTLDTTFGTGGEVTTNFVGVATGGASNPADSVLVQPNGDILVGGSATACGRGCPTESALALYNPDGTLDSAFGDDGTVTVTAIGGITALAEDANGDIFTLDGTQAAEFSSSGVLLPQVTPSPFTVTSSRGSSSVFQANGDYLAPAQAAGTSRRDVNATVVRYLPTGTVDTSFTSPVIAWQTPAVNTIQALAVQSNGQIVAAGLSGSNSGDAFTVARLNANGSLDTTFGSGGLVTTALPDGGQASVVVIEPDGEILVVGEGFVAGGGLNLVLALYLAS
jgi:uncharacterized delta-60 repeat protein